MEIYCINDIHIDSHWKSPSGIRLGFYKKFIEENTLPADVLAICGDISNDINGAVNFLCAASTMFDKVVWVPGNCEYRCLNDESNLFTFEKLNKIDKFVKPKSKSGRIVHLDSKGYVFQDGKTIVGNIGMADDSWFRNTRPGSSDETIQEEWENSAYKFWKIGPTSFTEISKLEIGNVLDMAKVDADYVMTHFAPSNLVNIEDYPSVKEHGDTRFLCFDATSLTDSLKDGAVYHFGHMHIKEKRTVKNQNGEFLLINNSIGRKKDCVDNPKGLTKQDFLLTI